MKNKCMQYMYLLKGFVGFFKASTLAVFRKNVIFFALHTATQVKIIENVSNQWKYIIGTHIFNSAAGKKWSLRTCYKKK